MTRGPPHCRLYVSANLCHGMSSKNYAKALLTELQWMVQKRNQHIHKMQIANLEIWG